ncbi:MAG: serine--tRNA ligase, partial [Pseudobdellovibrionaceae bacterium]
MIDVKLLEGKDDGGAYFNEYKQSLINRGADPSVLDSLMDLNKKRKELIHSAESSKAHQNKVSQDVAVMKRNKQDASALISEMQELGKKIKEMELSAQEADEKVHALASTLPNKCHVSVPVGHGAEGNKIVHAVGEPTKFSFKAKEHWEIGEKLGILDFERAGKVTGTRFTFLKGAAAKMERALAQLMMDMQSAKGYVECIPPYIVNSKSYYGTGQFPKFQDDVFHLTGTDYHLISTAEVPVTNFFAEEILNEEQLPQKFCAYSPCFRSEAGSHGRDTKGLIRQHQFHKVELMVFAHPNNSYDLHEQLTKDAEDVLKKLELPFRRMALCTGDIGFGAAKCFDLEVWLPGPGEYREI